MVKRQAKRAFTLIEILIVVVILGILAAIVIPQFTSASQDAQDSSVRSQLQTVRGQIELYQIRHPDGDYPDFSDADEPWNDMINPSFAGATRFLQSAPRNAARSNATGIVIGEAVDPGDDAGGADGDGWYWDEDNNVLYAIDRDGTILDW